MNNDLISRYWVEHNVLSLVDAETRMYAEARLNNAPSVEVRPQGEWVCIVEGNLGINTYKCSVCGHRITCTEGAMKQHKGCYCGAQMKDGAKE